VSTGRTDATTLAKEAEVPRTKIYETLNRLEEENPKVRLIQGMDNIIARSAEMICRPGRRQAPWKPLLAPGDRAPEKADSGGKAAWRRGPGHLPPEEHVVEGRG